MPSIAVIRSPPSHQSSSSAISRLPEELLVAIFLECILQWHAKYKPQVNEDIPTWVRITHVNRAWRNAALGCPLLWTRLFFTSPRWIDELFQRSKPYPLVMHARMLLMDAGTTTNLVKKALEHIERIQDLRIDCSFASFKQLSARISVAAPLLRRRYLCWVDVFPSKYVLEMSRVHFLSPISRGLSVLKLSLLTPTTVDWNDVLQLLHQLPLLRNLALSEVFSGHLRWDVSEISVDKIAMSKLERLTLVDRSSVVAGLLDHLLFPKSTLVRLECSSIDDLSVFPLVTKDKIPLPRFMDISCARPSTDRWELTCGIDSLDEQDADPPFFLKIKFGGIDGQWESDFDSIIMFFCSLPFTHLQTIAMHGSFEIVQNDRCLWTEAFGHARGLQSIRLENGIANDLIHALQPHSEAISAPNLINFAFKGIAFSSDEHAGDGYHQNTTSDISCLYDALSNCRVKLAEVLGTLPLDHCTGINTGKSSNLREVVSLAVVD
ncbi:hypothetical protein J3A83DRAFT_4367645 [Scleroderma citrinum]